MPSHRLHFAAVLITGTVLFVATAPAQPLSNASLKGAYNVRYLGANVDFNNPTDTALGFSGTVTFDGSGAFTVTGQGVSKATGGFKLAPTGTYFVLPGGAFYMTNPFDPGAQAYLYGGVSPTTGAIVASGTDTVYTDLLVGIAAGTSVSATTLSGKYFISSLDFQGGDFSLTRNTFFSASTTGSGTFGDWAIKGTALNLNSVAQTQTSPSVTYTLTANGTGTLTIPVPTGAPATANQLLSGSKVLYVSADGNLFVAGGSSAYDMVIGVKAISGSPSTALTGRYFTGLLENFADGGDSDGLYGAQGAALESNGTEIANLRQNWEFFGTFDFNYGFPFNGFGADGTLADPGYSNYVVGAGGNLVLGSGDGTNYQLNLYLKAPSTGTPSGSVYIDPQGIVNAATYIPFTAQVVPGEYLLLNGSGLATGTTIASSLPFPTNLGGVTVTLTWKDSAGTSQTKQAPIYYVTPTVIAILTPYGLPVDGSFVNFQVTNNGTNSNVVPMYSGATSPGFFTQPQNGLGDGAIRHAADNSVVTTANPAKVGETVSMYLTGLGTVTPAVADGAAAPSSPLATVSIPFISIDGVEAKVSFAGLTPGLAGLYQLNVTIPAGVTAGKSVYIHVETDDADNIQATIPISK